MVTWRNLVVHAAGVEAFDMLRMAAAGRGVDEPFRRVAGQLADIEAAKHRSRLVAPEDLPRREKGAPRMHEGFWRQAASGKEAPRQLRRQRTLAAPRRRPPRLPGPGKRWAAACMHASSCSLTSKLFAAH
jgi:hypothetical protein